VAGGGGTAAEPSGETVEFFFLVGNVLSRKNPKILITKGNSYSRNIKHLPWCRIRKIVKQRKCSYKSEHNPWMKVPAKKFKIATPVDDAQKGTKAETETTDGE